MAWRAPPEEAVTRSRRTRKPSIRLLATFLAAVGVLGALPVSASGNDAGDASPITHTTSFVTPGPNGEADLTVENYIVRLIDATPPGAEISFAVRDWTRTRVAPAVVNASRRGVHLTGVIDGGERFRPFLINMVVALGGDVIFCGTPDFTYHSCISNALVPGLQHNKFWTFSRLNDGSTNVVVQTSQNFTAPQNANFQDLVRIDGDVRLYEAYRAYAADMKAQLRTDDYFASHVVTGDDGRNTMFPFPRRQENGSPDTIVELLDDIDCSAGGSSSGTGLIRVAQAEFRRERMAIVDRLIALERAGCVVEVVNSHGHADIVANLVHGGIAFYPLFLGKIGVDTHTKYWLVDAKSKLGGVPVKTVYAGSANWRANQLQTDDMLLRIVDDVVYNSYNAHWEHMRSRSDYNRRRSVSEITDDHSPFITHSAEPDPGATGWNRSTVSVRLTASDGVGDYLGSGATGIKRVHIEMTGAQSGSWELEGAPYTVVLEQTLMVTAEGVTTVTFFTEDHAGRTSEVGSQTVRIDRTPPTISGLPQRCVLWPPNHRLVHVASVSASDGLSGVARLDVTASSSEPDDGTGDGDTPGDIVVRGGDVTLRAERAGLGSGRVYTITAAATDVAGNASSLEAACFVPHDVAGSRGQRD
jgi:hypothetical protein